MAEAVDAKIKKRFNAMVRFEVDGEQFDLNASTKEKDTPDLTVKTSLQVLQDLLERKIMPPQAFVKGKIKVKGKMSLAMKLQLILDATRKHLKPTSKL